MTTFDPLNPDNTPQEDIEESSIFNQIKHALDEIGNLTNRVNDLGNQIKHGLDEANKAVDEVGKVTTQVNRLSDELNSVSGQVKDLPQQMEKTAEDVFKKAIDAIAEDISKTGLQKFHSIVDSGKKEMDRVKESKPKLVDDINQASIHGSIGIFTLTWSGFYDRADAILGELDKRIEHPPSLHRSEILEMVKALGPSKLDIDASVEVALGLGSNQLGMGGGIGDITIDLFLEIADGVMEKLGIPK
jgi:uncharacterized protein YoxC